MSREKNPNREGYLAHVEDMKHMENDVDKLLDAARLKRIERGGSYIHPGRIAIAIVAMVCIAVVCGLIIYMDFAHSRKPGMLAYSCIVFGLPAIFGAVYFGVSKGE